MFEVTVVHTSISTQVIAAHHTHIIPYISNSLQLSWELPLPSFTDQASQLALAAEVCINGNLGEEKDKEVKEQQQRKKRSSSLEMQQNQTELRHPVMSEGKQSQPATPPA